jgi:hypothetical protein
MRTQMNLRVLRVSVRRVRVAVTSTGMLVALLASVALGPTRIERGTGCESTIELVMGLV